MQLLCRQKFPNPLGEFQGVWFLDIMVRLYLVLSESAKLSSKTVVPFCFSTSNQWMRIPVAPYTWQRMMLSVFQVLAILIDTWLYVILVCISMMKYDVNIFICLLSTCISSFVSVFEGLLLIFKPVLCYCWVLCIFWIIGLYQICLLQKYSPSLCLVFLLAVSFAE